MICSDGIFLLVVDATSFFSVVQVQVSYDNDKIAYSYNDRQKLKWFIQVVSGQEKYNRPGQPVYAIPIVVYHRIDNSRAPYSTTVPLFMEEMKYLYNNGFRVTDMADLVYNNSTNSFYLKNTWHTNNLMNPVSQRSFFYSRYT